MVLQQERSSGASERRKAQAIVRMREGHKKTLEKSSEKTFRKRKVATAPAPRLVSAARKYKGMGWLPAALIAPEVVPREAQLPIRYVLPYYAVGKAGWWLYGRNPIDPHLRWDPQSDWNDLFPKSSPDWGAPTADRTFTQLRLQGPNPFMLRKASPDQEQGDSADGTFFDLDFSRLFEGVFAPTIARFETDQSDLGMHPVWISIASRVHRPGEDGWDDAKRVVNALDVRTSAFLRHLLNTHLMVGQAYAIAAFSLPVWHPLRPFMDFFTYGTMHVNDMAFTALLTPDSYFIRSNLVSAADARLIIQNAMDDFDFTDWIVPKDLARRGIAEIPGHPYVADALMVWPAIERVVERHLNDLDIDDHTVANDPDLRRWHDAVRAVLPDTETVPSLNNRQDLEELLTALIYNNVIHEVCGNLAPLLDSADPADKVGINFDHLRSLVDPDRVTEQPLAADVFLMDQTSFVSRFNVAGNNLIKVKAARYIDDPRLRQAVEELQDELLTLDAEITRRNGERDIPFETMQPSAWEASISF